eukprot:6176687-Pleurochrysis_carterae.AAC.1
MTSVYKLFKPARRRRSRQAEGSGELQDYNLAHRGEQWEALPIPRTTTSIETTTRRNRPPGRLRDGQWGGSAREKGGGVSNEEQRGRKDRAAACLRLCGSRCFAAAQVFLRRQRR